MITLGDGHEFLWANIFSFIAIVGFCWYLCWTVNSKKFDKTLHTLICSGITFGSIWIFSACHIAWWWAPVIALAVGLIKEIVDLINPRKKLFDVTDLVADVVGTAWISICYLFSFIIAR